MCTLHIMFMNFNNDSYIYIVSLITYTLYRYISKHTWQKALACVFVARFEPPRGVLQNPQNPPQLRLCFLSFNQSSSLETFSLVTPKDHNLCSLVTPENWRSVRAPVQFCLTYIFIGLSVEKAYMIGRIIVRNNYVKTKLSSHCFRRDYPRT